MKPTIAFRPRVEFLENRLQPGSLLTLPAYSSSLLVEDLLLRNQQAWDSQNVEILSSSESSKPTPAGTPREGHATRQDIPAALPAVSRSDSSSRPTHDLGGDPTGEWTSRLWHAFPIALQLENSSLGNPRGAMPLPTVAAPAAEPPPPAAPSGSGPQSPLGVAAPAPAAVAATMPAPSMASAAPPVSSASGIRAVPVQMSMLDSGTVQTFVPDQTTDHVHAVPLALTNGSNHRGGEAGNQATLNFLSYLGGSGPASINDLAVRTEKGTHFMYVAGSLTDSTGRTDAFAAKLTDGATAVVWATALTLPAPGPDKATGLALNGKNVYVTGAFADPAFAAQSDGFIAQLDSHTGQLLNGDLVPNGSLAAVTTDPAGNVYAAGWIPDPGNLNQHDIVLVKVSGDLSSTIYSAYIQYQSHTGVPATSAVTTGGGLIVDGQGNLYFAASIGLVNDPNSDMEPLFGWLNDSAGLALYANAATPNYNPGPRGMGTAVALDPSGNLVFTGSLNDNGGTRLNQDLVLGRLLPTLVPYIDSQGNLAYKPGFAVVDAWRWMVDDRTPAENRVGDWTSNDLVVLADGSTIVTGAAYDPAAPNRPPLSMPTNGIDVHLTHFTSGDNNTVTTQNSLGDPENVFGGSGTDVGTAVALDPAKPTNVYVAGNTTSTDLPTTPGVLQPTFSGGSTGFVGQASVG